MIRSVYIIGVQDNPVKIGVADDVTSRLCNLQIGCPDELTIFHVLPFPDMSAALVECAAHRELKDHWRRGEWFNVSAETARLTIERVAITVVPKAATAFMAPKSTLDRVREYADLSEWATDAVGAYLAASNDRSRLAEFRAMNRAIMDRVGTSALTVFQCMLSSSGSIEGAFYRQPGKLKQAMTTLASAINALAAHYREKEEDNLLDEILGNVA